VNESNTNLADTENVAGRTEATQKARRRRRSSFTLEIAELICDRLVMGESLRQICKDPKMPARSSIFVWLREHKEFADQYRLAKWMLIEDLLFESLEIADDSTNDWVYRQGSNGQTYRVVNHDNIRRSKLQIDARRGLISKLKPKKYGLR
jgi:hypothetical protein